MQVLDQGQVPLLNAYALLHTDSAAATVEALYLNYRVRNVQINGSTARFSATANRVELNDVALHFCHYSGDTDIQFSAMPGYRQFLCLKGSGRVMTGNTTIGLSSRSTGILPPQHEFRAVYEGDYHQLVMVFDPQSLIRHCEVMSGQGLNRPVMLPTLQTLDGHQLVRFRSVALCLAAQFAKADAVQNPAVRELEQALLSSFLFEHQHNFSHLLTQQPKLAAAWQIRVVEDYIEANWHRSITVEDIAKTSGVSVRSVFASFKRHRGCSPMAFLRDRRLFHARNRLLEAGDNVSVSAVGIACGFHSFGHFARHYREKFGELPSATLARSRTSGPHDRPVVDGPP